MCTVSLNSHLNPVIPVLHVMEPYRKKCITITEEIAKEEVFYSPGGVGDLSGCPSLLYSPCVLPPSYT